jgi:hypothetical protein
MKKIIIALLVFIPSLGIAQEPLTYTEVVYVDSTIDKMNYTQGGSNGL